MRRNGAAPIRGTRRRPECWGAELGGCLHHVAGSWSNEYEGWLQTQDGG